MFLIIFHIYPFIIRGHLIFPMKSPCFNPLQAITAIPLVPDPGVGHWEPRETSESWLWSGESIVVINNGYHD